jgi:hypothetical protein
VRASQAGPPPQEQKPSSAQESDVRGSHLVQATPPVPQVLKVEVVQ